jgi:hypothetical protein
VVTLSSRLAAPLGGCALLLAASWPAQAQTATPAAASGAFAIQANFTAQTMTTELGPVANAAGSAPPAYDVVKVLSSYDQSIAVPPLVPNAVPVAASFTAEAQGIRSEAASAGIQIDFVNAAATSSVGSASLMISQSFPPSPASLLLAYLNVNATNVATSASYSKVFPQTVSVSGSASFGSLSIGGSLLGGESVSYAGTAPANTILFQSATVTITANQQSIAYLISCSLACKLTPTRIIVHGLDIQLTNALINGFPVTGEIVLGDASAQ